MNADAAAGMGDAAADPPPAAGPDRAAEVARRIAIVQDGLRVRGHGAVLLSERRNTAWLTVGASLHVVVGGDAAAGPILVHQGGATAIAPNNETDRVADEELGGLPIDIVTVPWSDPRAIDAEVRRRTSRGTTDRDVESWLQPVRSVLGPTEQGRMEWLGRRVVRAMDDAVAAVAPGTTEDDAVAALVGGLAVDGIRAPVVLAAADDRIARYRHPLPGATRVARRLMLITVGERWGLHVALTRFRELEPLPDDLAARVAATDDVLAAMEAATVPGGTFGDVFVAAREAYGRAGHPDEWRLHHQGGSIGYTPREHIAVPGDRTRIAAGMAFAWNPSITGAKAESTIVLDGDGGRRSVTAG